MAKRKLLIKDKEEILRIIAKYLDNKELKELKDKLAEKQAEFEQIILEDYSKTFNLDKSLLNFANKYNYKSTVYVSFSYNYGDRFDIFDNKFNIQDDFMYQCYAFDYNFKLPFYDRLNYVPYGNYVNITSNYIKDKYTDYVREFCKAIHEKSKEVLEIYKTIKDIITSSDYVEDFENIIDIQEVTNYINQRFINKKSTAICALNKEKIDFVKNYLTSIK